MMASFSLATVAKDLNTTVVGDDVEFTTVSTDSRHGNRNALFVALTGESFDGNLYVDQAQQQGAVAAVVSKQPECAIPFIQVSDTRLALGQLGRLNRRQFEGRLVAITGSAGKTTCKELVAAILGQRGLTHATKGNLNNEIGVPLTLLGLTPEHKFAVVEMGASKGGDIAYLCDFAEPDVALITNIMSAHLEGFGNLAGVARAKSEIYNGLSSSGIAIVNSDDVFVSECRKQIGDRNTIAYALTDKSVDVYASEICFAADSTCFILHYHSATAEVNLGLAGEHNVRNALAAAAVGLALDLSIAAIVAGLESVKPAAGRQQRFIGPANSVVIDDSYNANPGSVRAGIDMLTHCPEKKWLLLGDMAELGEGAQLMHEEIGHYAKLKGIQTLLAVGKESTATVNAFGEGALHFDTQQELINYCQLSVDCNCVLLVKGSRSAQMENVIAGLVNNFERTSQGSH